MHPLTKFAILIIVYILLGWFICQPLTEIGRTRPYEVIEGLVRIIEKQSDRSFPSGHTASSFAAATVLGYYFKKYRYGFYGKNYTIQGVI